MAFASGAVTCRRFAITGPFPESCDDALLRALQNRTFGRAPVQSDDTQMGWIGPGHLFETDLAAERLIYGDYVHLALRVDTLRAPAGVVRAYVQLEEEALRTASGRPYLSKGEQRQARLTARERATQEAHNGDFRRMRSYPVLIDVAHRMVYLGTSGNSAADRLMALFGDTCGASLQPLTPEELATRYAQRAGRARALEGVTPGVLVEPPQGYEESAGGFRGDVNFLGKEFLTWLWAQADANDGPVQLRSGDDVTVLFDKLLRMKCDFGLTGVDTIAADQPTTLPEARAALGIGKQPVRAGLVLGSPLGEFALTLTSDTFAISGLVLPEDAAERDPRVRFEQRFESVTDAATLLDALFELFLEQRLGQRWDRELERLSAWARGTKSPRTPKLVGA